MSDHPTLPEHLRRLASSHSEGPALVDGHDAVSFTDLAAQIDRTADALSRTGLARGDRVALALQPSAAYAVLILAALAGGYVPITLNTRLTASETVRFLEPLDAQVVLTDVVHESLAGQLGLPVILLASTYADSIRERMAPLGGGDHPTVSPVEPDSPALILPTGGTSGTPKGVWFDHAALWRVVASAALNLPRQPEDLDLYFAPFFHIMFPAQLLPPVFMGGATEILTEFDPGLALESIGRGASRFGGVPTLMRRLRQHPAFGDTRRDHVSRVLFGAAPATTEFIEELLEDYPNASVTSLYGATEYGGTVCTITHGDLVAGELEGVGRPRPGQSVRILSETGQACAPGEIGYFSVRSIGQANGYWGRPEETADVFRSTGMRVGDMGWYDHSGRFYIIGRDSEMIVTGGENVFPSEVEPAIAAHPAVREVLVYGVPDDDWGHRVEALVVPVAGESPRSEELRSFLADRVAGYKRPKAVHLVDAIPMTANNKPDRKSAQRVSETLRSSERPRSSEGP